MRACDASRQRLGFDHIDLYYQHRVDRTVAGTRYPAAAMANVNA